MDGSAVHGMNPGSDKDRIYPDVRARTDAQDNSPYPNTTISSIRHNVAYVILRIVTCLCTNQLGSDFGEELALDREAALVAQMKMQNVHLHGCLYVSG